jgi:hypothetical protein
MRLLSGHDIPPGGAIEVPAIYTHLPMATYLASSLLGSSELKDFWKRGPRFYQMKHVLGMYPDETTEALVFGQAFEVFLDVGEGAVRSKWPVRPPAKFPDGTPNPEGNFARKEGKAWLAAHGYERADDVPLTHEDMATMAGMAQALREHELADHATRYGAKQLTFTCKLPCGLGGQSRPDYAFLEGDAFTGFCPATVDLKAIKTEDFAGMGLKTSCIVNSFYDIQAATARTAMRAQGIDNSRHFIMAVEKGIPHRMDLVELAPSFLDIAEQRMNSLAESIARHHERNDWPRSFPGSRQLVAPRWYTPELPSDIDNFDD